MLDVELHCDYTSLFKLIFYNPDLMYSFELFWSWLLIKMFGLFDPLTGRQRMHTS